jgi:hypothetical protein
MRDRVTRAAFAALSSLIAACASAPRTTATPAAGGETIAHDETEALPPDDVVVLRREATVRPVAADTGACLALTVERELLVRSVAGRRAALPVVLVEGDGVAVDRFAGATTTPDGRVWPLAAEHVRRVPLRGDDGALVTGARHVLVDFPHAGPGARVVCRYEQRVCSRPPSLSWPLQEPFPVLSSVLTLVEPDGARLRFAGAGLGTERPPAPLSGRAAHGGGRAHRFEMTRVTPRRDEPGAPSLAMEAARIDVALEAYEAGPVRESHPVDWAGLGALARQRLAQGGALDEAALPAELRRGGTPEALARFVRESVRTRPVALEVYSAGAATAAPPAEVLAAREGTVFDKAALLAALVARSGEKAWPALLASARVAPIDPAFPRLHGLDHALVAVASKDGSYRFFDPATAADREGGERLPWWLQGLSALVLRDDGALLARTPFDDMQQNRCEATARLRLTDDDRLDGTLELTLAGQRAEVARDVLGAAAADAAARAQALEARLWPGEPPGRGVITEVKAVRGLAERGKALRLSLRVSMGGAVVRGVGTDAGAGGGIAALTPGRAVAPLPDGVQPLPRTASLLLPYAEDVSLRVEVTLPRRARAELPAEPVRVASALGTGEVSWSQQASVLTVNGRWTRPAQLVPPYRATEAAQWAGALREAWHRPIVIRE